MIKDKKLKNLETKNEEFPTETKNDLIIDTDINNYKVAIVTPTILSDFEKLKRCIKSVQNQTYNNIQHIIIIDNFYKKEYDNMLNYFKDNFNCEFYFTESEKSDTWGAYPRQFFLDEIVSENPDLYKYVVHLDDDNYMFPEYVKEMVDVIEKNNVDAAICKIYHHGPVSPNYFKNYDVINEDENVVCIVSGNPPVLMNIDTLNVMIKTDKMYNHGWVCKKGYNGYCNDGETFESLFKNIEYVYLNKILAIHY